MASTVGSCASSASAPGRSPSKEGRRFCGASAFAVARSRLAVDGTHKTDDDRRMTRAGLLVASVAVLVMVASAQSRPSSGVIAFQVYVQRNNTSDGIYLTNADGGGLHRLQNQPPNSFGPRWSPDGRRLLIVSLGRSSIRLFVIGAEGGNRRLVLSGHRAGQTPGYADWSPDGTRIAVLRGTPCTRSFLCNASLYVFSLSSGAQDRIAHGVLGLSPPAWAPNGRLIAFAGETGGLFVVSPNGDSQRQITGGFGAWPVWSPDGRSIAFTLLGKRTRTYTVGLDGRDRQLLLAGDSAAVSWSHDGKRIAFTRGSYSGDLYTADGDGGHATRITRDRRDETLPDWQPQP